jgi:subtilisin family serine protease
MPTPRNSFPRSPFRWACCLWAVGLTSVFVLVPFPTLAPKPVAPAAVEGVVSTATPETGAEADSTDEGRLRAELLEQLGVTTWHAAGYRGRGVKIAVLDSGFRGYRAHLGKALPDRVAVKSFTFDGNLEARDSQHGILCSEVIATLAPEAELLLANWEPERPGQFLEAVTWAREQGARIVSCSVIMPSWSDGEGHGPVHETLARLLGPGDGRSDGLCFASAGNTAQRHWSGPFHDAGDGRHDWGGRKTENVVTPWGGERVSVELCAPPGAFYELTVRDETAKRDAGRARTPSEGERHGVVAAFNPVHGHSYRVVVRLVAGQAGSFHLVVLGGGLEQFTSPGSIPFPGDGPEVLAVGAVDRDGRRWAYSSCGPNSSCPKPDFVATVPFPSAWRSQPFSGTSAAAPQAAALAALLWSRHPDWTAGQVRAALRSAVRRLGSQDHDDETGYGRIQLPAMAAKDRAPKEKP